MTPDSDADYKLFILPEFDDLYENNLFSTPNIVTKEVDYDIHDIRQFGRLLRGANINYMEVLFSDDVEFPCYKRVPRQLKTLFEMREDIARMNLSKFYASCVGTHIQKMKMLLRGTEGTKHLVDKFGYDTKQACHAYRVLDAAERYCINGFRDFKRAIRYEDSDRQRLLDIKSGVFNLAEFKALAATKMSKVEVYKEYFYVPDDTETLSMVKSLVKELVSKHVRGRTTWGKLQKPYA